MIMTYQECVSKFGSDYKIKKALEKKIIFQEERGIYSTKPYVDELELIMHKYPHSVFTGESAFFFLSLTTVIPRYHYVSTKRNDTRIRDERVKQSFVKEDIFEQGIIQMQYDNADIRVYDMERMLVELMRFRQSYSLDYYKEVIQSYRDRVYEMEFLQVEKYASMFKNHRQIMDRIQLEVL